VKAAGDTLLDVKGLTVAVRSRRGSTPILRGVDIGVRRGEILGLVGETGAGKSITARAILGLLANGIEQTFESYTFDGREVRSISEVWELLGSRIAFVPQNPRGSLNPVFTIGDQLQDVVGRLRGLRGREAAEESLRLLTLVQIPDPKRRMQAYPHELSGGMCQRVCIAIALSGKPDLIIADEPTTGLDVTTQAEILALLRELIAMNGSAGILISHDVGVIAQLCDRVAVMYAGRVVNIGKTGPLFDNALHPYASLLLGIASKLDDGEDPEVIPGHVPAPKDYGSGCVFAPRCYRALDVCRTSDPPLVERQEQRAWCYNPLPEESSPFK
jgi:peptide/nickel transport system ATP-binding protein